MSPQRIRHAKPRPIKAKVDPAFADLVDPTSTSTLHEKLGQLEKAYDSVRMTQWRGEWFVEAFIRPGIYEVLAVDPSLELAIDRALLTITSEE